MSTESTELVEPGLYYHNNDMAIRSPVPRMTTNRRYSLPEEAKRLSDLQKIMQTINQDIYSHHKDNLGNSNDYISQPGDIDEVDKREEEHSFLFRAHPRRMVLHEQDKCKIVCGFCAVIASSRMAALCSSECDWNGRYYQACLTVWTRQIESS